MSGEAVTLELIGRMLADIQKEQRRIRADYESMLSLVVGQSDWNRLFEQRLSQFDQRLVEQTDMLVGEMKARIGISQTQVGRRMDDLAERVDELETGKPRFTP